MRLSHRGDNQDGTLGIGDDQNRGGKEDEMGKMLPEVQLGGKAVFLATGGWHNCAILHQGELKW